MDVLKHYTIQMEQRGIICVFVNDVARLWFSGKPMLAVLNVCGRSYNQFTLAGIVTFNQNDFKSMLVTIDQDLLRVIDMKIDIEKAGVFGWWVCHFLRFNHFDMQRLIDNEVQFDAIGKKHRSNMQSLP
jgi:hypothetical protein